VEEIDRIIAEGYAAERAAGVQWSAPLAQRLSVQHYDHQRDFVKQAAVAFFQSGLFKENIAHHACPAQG
jgi:hypothetical protein